MRRVRNQQTLAMLMAGVLFSGAIVTADPHGNLAWELYSEGDWRHARTEALRQVTTSSADPALDQALAGLAALRLDPEDDVARRALQAWLAAHSNHTQHAWVAAEHTHSQTPQTADLGGFTAFLARRFVGFYQRQIGPAIGQRCAMYPSCSHYSLEACRRYGLAGIPMTADRLVRESHHIRYRIHPIQQNGVERYVDPVTNHSYWFRKYTQ